ncbi:hypothetical protein M3Y99_01633200 [Aphelenchoides fujianensis]|nr:hypothetical protein M3Y99_01633200 [Aphelenchoides fujianensis]
MVAFRSWLSLITWIALVDQTAGLLDFGGRRNEKMVPKDAFPTPSFDKDAPYCALRSEPCGFYSFSLSGNQPFKWVKSWCQCSPDAECVYERTDMRMRVFRQVCAPAATRSNDSKAELRLAREENDGEEHSKHHHHHSNALHPHRQHGEEPKPHHKHGRMMRDGDENVSQFVTTEDK